MYNFNRLTLIVSLIILFVVNIPFTCFTQPSWRYSIYIPTEDRSVTLGVIDGLCYNPESDLFCSISDEKMHRIYVIASQGSNSGDINELDSGGSEKTFSEKSNSRLGPPQCVLNLEASVNMGDLERTDLADLRVEGGDITNWTGLENEERIKTINNWSWWFGIWVAKINDIQYRYQVDINDTSGSYRISLLYTLSTP